MDELRHGYTLADLDRLAHASLNLAWPRAMDYRDRYDAAWHTIAELLYSSSQRPTPHDLGTAGAAAVNRLALDEARHHGLDRSGPEPADRPAFQRYWTLYRVTPSHEDRVVDRVALAQIWPALRDIHRRTLLALAVHEDHAPAAAAIGRTPGTYRVHLKDARAGFRALWHEHETPSRMWGRSMGSLAGQRTAAQVLVQRRRARTRKERAA